jgi:hypothetical protein
LNNARTMIGPNTVTSSTETGALVMVTRSSWSVKAGWEVQTLPQLLPQ